MTFVHGDVVDGSALPSSGSWPGKPEYAQINWSEFRNYGTIDGRIVLVNPALPAPEAMRADLQARLDAMGPDDGRPEVRDANGITPSEDLVLRTGHVGKQLVTVRLHTTATAGVFEWRASTTNGPMLGGTDREVVLQQVNDWLATYSDPTAWVVGAASGPRIAPGS